MARINDIRKEVNEVAKNAAYVTIGLGVIGYQRAQVRRNELAKRVQQRLDQPSQDLVGTLFAARQEVAKRAKDIDGKLEKTLDRIDSTISPLEDKLPEEARAAVKYAHSQARSVRKQITEKILSSVA